MDLIKTGIYCCKPEAVAKGAPDDMLAVLLDVKDNTASIVVIEEENINNPHSFDGRIVFRISAAAFLDVFTFSGMYTREAVEDENGDYIFYSTAEALMDDEIREKLHRELAPCTNQAFYDAYCLEHRKKYGTPFMVN